MRIGFDARMIRFTGIGRNVYNLAVRLPELDPGNEYVFFVRPEDRPQLNLVAPNLRLVDTISTYYDVAEQTRHLSIVQKEQLDLFHVPHFNIPIRYHGKLVVTIHDLIQAKMPSQSTRKAQLKRLGYAFVIRQALRKATRVIAVSNFTKNDISQTFGTNRDKIDVIYNGVDERFEHRILSEAVIDPVLEKYGLVQPFVLYVGLQSLHKNLGRLIDAMALVRDHGSAVPLAIVGKQDDRYTPALIEQVRRLKLQDYVRLCGFVPDSALEVLYNTATAFVFPSLYEGFGIPPVEALAAGLPVICSDAASLPEVLGDQAVYFDARDPTDIAAKIRLVLDQPDKYQPRIQPAFSWDTMAEKTVGVYREVLRQDQRSA